MVNSGKVKLLLDRQEVTGSIPVRPTLKGVKKILAPFYWFESRIGNLSKFKGQIPRFYTSMGFVLSQTVISLLLAV